MKQGRVRLREARYSGHRGHWEFTSDARHSNVLPVCLVRDPNPRSPSVFRNARRLGQRYHHFNLLQRSNVLGLPRDRGGRSIKCS